MDHDAADHAGSRFRLFTKESLVRIERRVQEEKEAREAAEEKKKEEEHEASHDQR